MITHKSLSCFYFTGAKFTLNENCGEFQSHVGGGSYPRSTENEWVITPSSGEVSGITINHIYHNIKFFIAVGVSFSWSKLSLQYLEKAIKYPDL